MCFAAADAAAQIVAAWLGPFDQGLLRLYTVVAVIAGARVLIKWKSIALEFILHQRSGLDAAPFAWPGFGRKLKRKGKGGSSLRSSGSATGQAAAAPRKAQQAVPVVQPVLASVSDAGDDDFDEAGCTQREGSMLQVSMRPRSVPSAAIADGLTAQAPDAAAGAGTAAAAMSAPGAAVAGGWGAGSSQAAAAGPALGGREDDAVERLLLPLDR